MPHLHIVRDHTLGMDQARKLGHEWAQEVESAFGMECRYEEGTDADTLHFTRSGVSGDLKVTATQFALEAKLGFLLGAFKDKIEAQITENLDALLVKKA
jgi:putative polyhydroxyalkanoate system protein